MRRFFFVALALACCWGAVEPGRAQAPSNSGSQQNQAPKNPGDSNAPKPKPTQDANPFPEDTNSVPVMPNANSPERLRPRLMPSTTATSRCPILKTIRYAALMMQIPVREAVQAPVRAAMAWISF
jgi:hypothetical protein